MSLDAWRSHIRGSGGVEEEVKTNVRHLIDKILSRYSGEHTVYRELLQNADDASSKRVQIIFESPTEIELDKIASIRKVKCNRVIFKNDGIHFRSEDWARLKSIASGNPDEQKIGAFGVGFYSLFSITEEPFVSSGNRAMSFFWKGDMLYASSGETKNDNDQTWTSFLMDLREPSEVASNLEEFCRFLTTALAFTTNLKEITLFFNNHKLFHLEKKQTNPQSMSISRGIYLSTPQRMFTVKSVESAKIQIDAQMMNVVVNSPKSVSVTNGLRQIFKSASSSSSSFDSNIKESKVGSYSIFLRTITGRLAVSVSKQFVTQMERATKKPPPKQTSYSVVFTSKEEHDASELKSPVFANLVPFPEQGRVYIGFQTHQTTGIPGHMAARFMPTVERESIDFVDPYMKQWNRELLYVGGILSRCIYEDEMSDIGKIYKETVLGNNQCDNTTKEWIVGRAIHTLQYFQFAASTPSPTVSVDIENAFYKCAANLSVAMISTKGVLPASNVRILDDSVKGFIKETPVLMQLVNDKAKNFIAKLVDMGILRSLTTDDVVKELENRSLNEQEMTEAFKWWIGICYKSDFNTMLYLRPRFLGSTVLMIDEETPSERLIPLNQISTFLNPQRIPPETRLPTTCLPYPFSKSFRSSDLINFFGGWKELTLEVWIKFLVTDKPEDVSQDLELSPIFAENVLSILSRSWSSLAKSQKDAIINMLVDKSCIPTKIGMKKPNESYLPNVNIFDDLPTVLFSHKRIPDHFLESLGVRKHVELQLIFTRMISTSAWNHVDMIKYLTSIQGDLKEEGELDRLRVTSIFPMEGDPQAGGKPTQRYSASKLYEPLPILRELGLPLIDWPSKWRSGSEEGKFLSKLGLQRHPPLNDLLTIAGSDDFKKRDKGFSYLIDNFSHYQMSYRAANISMAFIPLSHNDSGKHLGTPKDCYTNEQARSMGFFIVHPDFRVIAEQKLGVYSDPPAEELKRVLLLNPPSTHDHAVRVFEYLASRLVDFSSSDRREMGSAKFIIVPKQTNGNVKESEMTTYVSPNDCYFDSKEHEEGNIAWMRDLFTLIDFGEQANLFLQACGVKKSPTVSEIVNILIQPGMAEDIYRRAGNVENYLTLLRKLASNWPMLSKKSDLVRGMKKASFLLASRKIVNNQSLPKKSNNESQITLIDTEEEENEGEAEDSQNIVLTWSLVNAEHAIIADDPSSLTAFHSVIRAAPEEESLEMFYEKLGSKRLSSIVKQNYQYGGNAMESPVSFSVKKKILERVTLFLHDIPDHRRLRTMDWLNKHLQVYEVEYIAHHRTLKIPDTYEVQKRVTRETAMISIENNKCVLYLANFDPLDYYDVALNLCQVLVSSPRATDTTVLCFMLEKTLKQLKRRGYPVDRLIQRARIEQTILERNQRLAKEEEEEKRRSELLELERQRKEHERIQRDTKYVQSVLPDIDPAYVRSKLQGTNPKNVNAMVDGMLNDPNGYPRIPPPPISGSLFSRIRSTLFENNTTSTPNPSHPVDSQRDSGQIKNFGRPVLQGGNANVMPNGNSGNFGNLANSGNSGNHGIDVEGIRDSEEIMRTLKGAVRNSTPHNSNTLESKEREMTVNEADESHCDATIAQSLRHVGEIRGMRFYISNDLNHHGEEVLMEYSSQVDRFVKRILIPLSKVYDVDVRAINVFIDKEGHTIAFNQNGSLFMNLRYYLREQDKEVQRGNEGNALVYWFSTLAHELAHNLVQPHSSAHEFYYSSFIEQYWKNLMVILVPVFDELSEVIEKEG